MSNDREKSGGLFSGLTPKDKRRLIIAGSSVVVLGTALAVGNHWWKKRKSRKAHSESLDQEDPSYFAKQIYLAIDEVGTDEDAIYDAFAKIPTQDFYHKVQKRYSELYKGKSLEEDLQDDLSGDEYEKVSNILAQKPDKAGQSPKYDLSQWSERLHEAADGAGTDEDEIYRVFKELPDKAAFAKLKTKFHSDWTYSLDEMLKDELDEEEIQKVNSIIAKIK